jgi:hypothetical protein
LVCAISDQEPSAFSISWPAGSNPGIGTSAGNPANAADELGVGDRRVGPDRLDDPRQRQLVRALDVHRHLGAPVAESDPDRPQPRQALAASLADRGGDRPGVLDGRGRCELQVEGDQRRAGGHERGAGARVHARRPEVRGERPLWVGHAPREPGDPAAAQLRPGAAREGVLAGELPVQEHRHVELLGEAVGEHERERARDTPVGRVGVHDRGDVQRADVRVLTGVLGGAVGAVDTAVGAGHHVDALDCHARAAQERVGKRGRGPGEREHRAMVVGVGVDVQQADGARAPGQSCHARLARRHARLARRPIGLAGERRADRRDGVRVAPLRDVRDGQKRRRLLRRAHDATRLLARLPPLRAGVAQLVRAAES